MPSIITAKIVKMLFLFHASFKKVNEGGKSLTLFQNNMEYSLKFQDFKKIMKYMEFHMRFILQ